MDPATLFDPRLVEVGRLPMSNPAVRSTNTVSLDGRWDLSATTAEMIKEFSKKYGLKAPEKK